KWSGVGRDKQEGFGEGIGVFFGEEIFPGMVVKSLALLLGSSAVKNLFEEVDHGKGNVLSSWVSGKDVPSNPIERE
ncbi:hypothetical protein KI387_037123, partial [Taxus chinensis]